jgi:hypothetical protein
MNEGKPRDMVEDFKSQYDVVVGLAQIVSFPVLVCTTRFGTWGSRYLGRHALFGFIWPMIFLMLYGPARPNDQQAVLLFWYASFVLLIVHRFRAFQLRRAGHRCHSHYWGDTRTLRTGDEDHPRRARHTMSLAVFGLAFFAFHTITKPLAAMFIVGCIGKFINDLAVFHALDARQRQMEDARIENEYHIELQRKNSHWI